MFLFFRKPVSNENSAWDETGLDETGFDSVWDETGLDETGFE